jgi:hypothetical protein
MGSAKDRKPPLTVEESVQAMLNVAGSITKKESGNFWSFEGHKLPY